MCVCVCVCVCVYLIFSADDPYGDVTAFWCVLVQVIYVWMWPITWCAFTNVQCTWYVCRHDRFVCSLACFDLLSVEMIHGDMTRYWLCFGHRWSLCNCDKLFGVLWHTLRADTFFVDMQVICWARLKPRLGLQNDLSLTLACCHTEATGKMSYCDTCTSTKMLKYALKVEHVLSSFYIYFVPCSCFLSLLLQHWWAWQLQINAQVFF